MWLVVFGFHEMVGSAVYHSCTVDTDTHLWNERASFLCHDLFRKNTRSKRRCRPSNQRKQPYNEREDHGSLFSHSVKRSGRPIFYLTYRSTVIYGGDHIIFVTKS